MKLEEIALLRTGVVLNRKKSAEKTEFKCKLLTLSSMSDEGLINKNNLEDFYSTEELNRSYFTEEGDIVVRLREPIIASYIGKDESNILVPSYFGIIRVRDKEFIPQYIATVINQEKIQKELMKDISGTAVTLIKIEALKDINIKKESIEKQERVGRIAELYMREMDLLRQLMNKKKMFYKELIKKGIK